MKNLCFTFLLISPLFTLAQEGTKTPEIKRNTLYLQFYSEGGLINFDRLYHLNHKIKTSFTAGLSFGGSFIATPISYNFLLGKKNHHLELGLGFAPSFERERSKANTFTIGPRSAFYSFLFPKIGYRFQKPGGGLFFRATFTPRLPGVNILVGGNGSNTATTVEYFKKLNTPPHSFPFMFGISLGYTF